MSNRLDDWLLFGGYVSKHIEEDTIPEYGDKGNDRATELTIHDLLKDCDKYIKRYGKVTKERQEKDFYKMVHCVCMAWDKWMDENVT